MRIPGIEAGRGLPATLIMTIVGLLPLSGPLQAATLYATRIGTWGLENGTLTNGVKHAVSDLRSVGHSAAWGEAFADGTGISVWGKTSANGDNGFLNQYHPQMEGSFTFNDLVISDPSNSGATSALLGVNFGVSFNSAIRRTQVNVTIDGHTTQVFNPVGEGNHTTALVNVPLNTPLTLTLAMVADQWGARDGAGNISYVEGQAAAWLRSTPFYLQDGFTADSADAGISGNSLSAVPLPAAAWLFGGALLGLGGLGRLAVKGPGRGNSGPADPPSA